MIFSSRVTLCIKISNSGLNSCLFTAISRVLSIFAWGIAGGVCGAART